MFSSPKPTDWPAVFEERFAAYGWDDPASAARVAVEALAAAPDYRGEAERLREALELIATTHDVDVNGEYTIRSVPLSGHDALMVAREALSHSIGQPEGSTHAG